MENTQPIPEGYDKSITLAMGEFEQMNTPRFKGYIKITVRAAGSNLSILKEIYCMDSDPKSRMIIFEEFCLLLQRAEKIYGKKDYIFEILNSRNDLLSNIKLNFNTKLIKVIDTAPVPTAEPAAIPPIKSYIRETAKPRKVKSVRLREDNPVVISERAPVPMQATAAIPAPTTGSQPEAMGILQPCRNPEEEIDYNSMKFYPTEITPNHIRKIFRICEIHTNGDILQRLGTNEPTFDDWEIFIKGIRSEALRAGVKLWPSADGIIFWWLSKKMRWISPDLKK
jgi:hypothetical protein